MTVREGPDEPKPIASRSGPPMPPVPDPIEPQVGWTKPAAAAVIAATLIGGGIYLSGADEMSPASYLPSDPHGLLRTDAKVAEFLKRCEDGVQDWVLGQISYPTSLAVPMDEGRSYVAAIDIRSTASAPEDLIRTQTARGDSIAVRCAIGAKLDSPGGGLTVDDENWVIRSFSPTGVINWGWSITGERSGDQELQLQLQPTLSTDDGAIVASGTEKITYVTNVRVDGSWLQEFLNWFGRHWGLIATSGATIGVAILGVMAWFGKFAVTARATARRVRRRPRRKP